MKYLYAQFVTAVRQSGCELGFESHKGSALSDSYNACRREINSRIGECTGKRKEWEALQRLRDSELESSQVVQPVPRLQTALSSTVRLLMIIYLQTPCHILICYIQIPKNQHNLRSRSPKPESKRRVSRTVKFIAAYFTGHRSSR